MAYPAFDAVRPSRSASGGSSGAKRVGALIVLLATSAIALSLTFGGSSDNVVSDSQFNSSSEKMCSLCS